MMPPIPPNNKGSLGKLPPELWAKVMKHLSPQDVTRLRQTSKDVQAELDNIQKDMTMDRWIKKLKKVLVLLDLMIRANIALMNLAKDLSGKSAIKKADYDLIQAHLDAYAIASATANRKLKKLKEQRIYILNARQRTELEGLINKVHLSDSTHEGQKRRVLEALKAATKKMVDLSNA